MILEMEQKLLGKVFRKKNEFADNYVYIKPISAITLNAPNTVHCIEFTLPTTKKFGHKGEFSQFHGRLDEKFDYGFDDDWFVWMEEEDVKDLTEKYELTSTQVFNEAFKLFFTNLQKTMTQTYTLEEVFGGEYAQKIREAQKEK